MKSYISLLILDQTPTPTRFLKNCEEVGLFNELASPFENEFKKASEDDIKKVCKCSRLKLYQFIDIDYLNSVCS